MYLKGADRMAVSGLCFRNALVGFGWACHGNFGPGKKLVRGTKVPGKMVRPDHFPPKKFGPDLE